MSFQSILGPCTWESLYSVNKCLPSFVFIAFLSCYHVSEERLQLDLPHTPRYLRINSTYWLPKVKLCECLCWFFSCCFVFCLVFCPCCRRTGQNSQNSEEFCAGIFVFPLSFSTSVHIVRLPLHLILSTCSLSAVSPGRFLPMKASSLKLTGNLKRN